MSDNEEAAAALGNSEILSVQNSVREPIPAFFQRPEDGAKVAPTAGRQQSRHIFKDDPSRTSSSGSNSANKRKGEQRQVATRVIQAASLAGDRERLAGRAEDDDV